MVVSPECGRAPAIAHDLAARPSRVKCPAMDAIEARKPDSTFVPAGATLIRRFGAAQFVAADRHRDGRERGSREFISGRRFMSFPLVRLDGFILRPADLRMTYGWLTDDCQPKGRAGTRRTTPNRTHL
jgi:hypothetical protein